VRGLPQNYIAQPSLWRAWRDPDWRHRPEGLSPNPPPSGHAPMGPPPETHSR
jgi:hypothetical protein